MHIDQYEAVQVEAASEPGTFFIKLHCQLPTVHSVYGQWKIVGMIRTP